MFIIGISPMSILMQNVIARLQAIVAPIEEDLGEGVTVSTITNYATLTNINNYNPPADSVEIRVNGAARPGTHVLALNDIVELVAISTNAADFTYEIDDVVGVARGIITTDGNTLTTSDGNILVTTGA